MLEGEMFLGGKDVLYELTPKKVFSSATTIFTITGLMCPRPKHFLSRWRPNILLSAVAA